MNKKTKILLISSLLPSSVVALPLMSLSCGNDAEVNQEAVDELQSQLQLISNESNNLLNTAPEIKFQEQNVLENISKLSLATKSSLAFLIEKVKHDKKLTKSTYESWVKQQNKIKENILEIKKVIKDRLFFIDEFYIKNQMYWEVISDTFKTSIDQNTFVQKFDDYNKLNLTSFLKKENWSADELSKIQAKFKLFDDIYQLTIIKVTEPSKKLVNDYIETEFWKQTVVTEKTHISESLLKLANEIFISSKEKLTNNFFENHLIYIHIKENLELLEKLIKAEIDSKDKSLKEKYEAVKSSVETKYQVELTSELSNKLQNGTDEEKKAVYANLINSIIQKITDEQINQTANVLKVLFSGKPENVNPIYPNLLQNYKDLIAKKNDSKNKVYIDYVEAAITKAKKSIEQERKSIKDALEVKLEMSNFYLLVKNFDWLHSFETLRDLTNELNSKLDKAEENEEIEKLDLKIEENLKKASELLSSPLSKTEELNKQIADLKKIQDNIKIKNFINTYEISYALSRAKELAIYEVEEKLESYGEKLISASNNPIEMKDAFKILLDSQKKTISTLFDQFTKAIIKLEFSSSDSKIMEDALFGFVELINTMTTVILEGAFELKDDASEGFDFLSKAINRKIKVIANSLSDLITKFGPVVEKTYSILFGSLRNNEVMKNAVSKECLEEFIEWNTQYYIDKVYGNPNKTPPVESIIPKVKAELEKITSIDISDPEKLMKNELAPVMLIWKQLIDEQDDHNDKHWEKWYPNEEDHKRIRHLYHLETTKKGNAFQEAIWSLGAPIIDLGTGYKTFYNVAVKLLK
ncbi:hypothetical protein PT313_00865 [Metamycoplasma hyosynoviae]|uniref:hypothetical protein n=1 Tax=Metamycoplasma hyosynoviae TaxID=29559 RepID=UPI0023608914|nr:hypothetical protein [Metamycoplasma hyosynoviae]MDD1372748.1 hypothetical protein [Metamycoplasma hyosynoviae]MDD1374150.1 hypothetical protein [Metamycoplasma hyosynoviae]